MKAPPHPLPKVTDRLKTTRPTKRTGRRTRRHAECGQAPGSAGQQGQEPERPPSPLGSPRPARPACAAPVLLCPRAPPQGAAATRPPAPCSPATHTPDTSLRPQREPHGKRDAHDLARGPPDPTSFQPEVAASARPPQGSQKDHKAPRGQADARQRSKQSCPGDRVEGPRASASSPVRGDLCPAPVSRAGLADRARVLREPRWEALSRCGHSAHSGTQSGWGQSLTLGQFPGRTVPPEHGVSEFASTELSGRNSTHWNVSSLHNDHFGLPLGTRNLSRRARGALG